IQLWDAGSGRELRQLRGPAGHVEALVFSPDATALAAAAGNKVLRWQVATGKELPTIEGLLKPDALAFASDGRTLASGSYGENRVGFWDVEAEKARRRFEDYQTPFDLQTGGIRVAGVRSLIFSPDGKKLLTASADGSVRWWDVAKGKEIEGVPRGARG